MINIIIVALNLIVNLYQGLAMEIYIVKMICFVYLAYCIIRMYKEEKSNVNQYYQAILYLWNRCGCNTSNFMDCQNYKISYFE